LGTEFVGGNEAPASQNFKSKKLSRIRSLERDFVISASQLP
jgi:hypothetical protein